MNKGLARFGRAPSRLALAAALALTTLGTATAQDQPAASSSNTMEEIVVTGSRIKTSDVTAAQPLTVITSEQIHQTEAVTAEQFLRKLPDIDFGGGKTGNDDNGGLGIAQIAMRNLQPQRTLILVNGQRFPFTDQNQESFASVDTNNIPLSMIDHVEILRDGASSIYGADAIAGVVNFITKKNYEGMEVDGTIGETSYGDGTRYDINTTMGTNFADNRGNILINVEYSHQDPIPAADRQWAVNQYPSADVNNYDGISSRITGAIGVIGGTKYYFPNGIGSGILASQAYTLGHPIDSVGIGYAGGGLTPGDIAIPGAGVYFNYLPTEGLIGSLERKQANLTGHYDITDGVTALVEAFFTDRSDEELLNPEPLGYNVFTPKFPLGLYIPATYQQTAGGPVLVNPYNPTNAANAAALYGAGNVGTTVPVLTRRFENGPRVYDDDVQTYRLRIGLEGTVYDNYDWELGFVYGKSNGTFIVHNEVNFDHLAKLAGILPCGADVAQGCSIANFFGYNSLTPAQAKYLVFDNTSTGGYSESTAYGSISGPLPDFVPELPGGPIKAAVGFEYRTEDGFESPNSVVANGDATIYTLPTSGGYNVGAGYVEVKAPVLKDLPFVKSLDINVSARYDYYSTFGRALTYKAGLDYAVNDDFRFRATNSTGFRAPQVRELYGGANQGAIGGSDPCATGGAFVNTPACVHVNGGNPASLTQVNQLTEIIGGNTSLKPETSQQWDLGGVFTPTVIPNLSVTVDYYTILVRSEIGAYNPANLLATCYGGVPYVISQAGACALIQRQGPNGTGNLGDIFALNGNIADENTDGIDISVNYGFDTDAIGLPGWGHIDLTGSANYLLSDNLSAGGVTNQFAGTANNTDTGPNGGEPRWKALLSTTWSMDNWAFNYTMRYYGGLKNADQSSYCPISCPAVGAGDYFGNESAGIFYHDISLTYSYDKYTVTVGVDNLFDKDPPFLPFNADQYIGAAGYDATGRFVYMKGSVKF